MQGSLGSIFSLLPLLVAGYLFNLLFLPSRYFAQRVDGQRLLFMSALSGLLIGFFCFAVRGWLTEALTPYVGFNQIAQLRATIPVPFGLTLIASIVSAPIIAFAMNAAIWTGTLPWRWGRSLDVRQFVSRRLTTRFGNAFVSTLRQAADHQKLVMVCLRSRKVYVGSILEIPADLDAPSHLEILPKFSGYRDKDTLKFSRTTEYSAHLLWTLQLSVYSRERERELLKEIIERNREVDLNDYLLKIEEMRQSSQAAIDQLQSEMSHNFSAEDWLKVLVVSDIESICLFDETAYSNWFLGDANGDDLENSPVESSHVQEREKEKGGSRDAVASVSGPPPIRNKGDEEQRGRR